MAALPNPAERLAAIVSQLYAWADNAQIPPAQQQAVLLQAHDLRGHLVTVVSMQFSEDIAAYEGVALKLSEVNAAIHQAEHDATQVLNVINLLEPLNIAIRDLLKEATNSTGPRFR